MTNFTKFSRIASKIPVFLLLSGCVLNPNAALSQLGLKVVSNQQNSQSNQQNAQSDQSNQSSSQPFWAGLLPTPQPTPNVEQTEKGCLNILEQITIGPPTPEQIMGCDVDGDGN